MLTGAVESTGRFGEFGGRYVSETLIPAVEELDVAYRAALADPEFRGQLDGLLKDYVGRPTPLYFAARLSAHVGRDVWLKREDLCHTGAHKVNNTVGQVLLALRMGKRRIIAETGAGQHGVATATACALLGAQCEVYMGAEDVRRQAPNVSRMQLLGAKVHPVESGSRTLKDAMNEALRDWVTNVEHTYYCVGSAAGPHPYPTLVRELQAIIGREARAQLLEATGALPAAVIACVGGGSNAIGMFHAFRGDPNVALIGVEAGGLGLASGKHAATLAMGKVGVLHGAKTYVLQDAGGQITEAHSMSAGLDYPGVGPEHAFLKASGRARYEVATDAEALEGFKLLCALEGIIPALETSHCFALLPRIAEALEGDGPLAVCLSGRGDKDLDTALEYLGATLRKQHA